MEIVLVDGAEASKLNKIPGWYVLSSGNFIFGPASQRECSVFINTEQEKSYSAPRPSSYRMR